MFIVLKVNIPTLCFRDNILNFTITSSTDYCYWNKSKIVEKYKAVPILKHKCFKLIVKSVVTLAIIVDNDEPKFIQALANSALSSQR